MKHVGNLIITKENQGQFKKLKEVTGNIDISENATADFPALQTSGNIYIMANATANFPALQTSGYIDIRANATANFPAIQTSGNIDISENATADFPLQAIKIEKNVFKIKNKSYTITRFDGVEVFVSSEKTSKGIKIYSGIHNVKINGKGIVFESGFVAKKGNFTAHGSELKKAIADLQFKITSDELKKSPIYMDTVMTDNYYRLLTGACELGVKNWKLQNNITVDEISVKELLPILERTNAYGVERFRSLIKER